MEQREIKFGYHYLTESIGSESSYRRDIDGLVFSKDGGVFAVMIDGDEWPVEKDMNGDHGVVVQYTGLKDRNGKEIYEGDIADYSWTGQFGDEFVQRGQFLSIIAQCGLAFGFDDIGQEIETGRTLEKNMRGMFTVIGNIYENPELLTK